jgi:hypothetical protein
MKQWSDDLSNFLEQPFNKLSQSMQKYAKSFPHSSDK